MLRPVSSNGNVSAQVKFVCSFLNVLHKCTETRERKGEFLVRARKKLVHTTSCLSTSETCSIYVRSKTATLDVRVKKRERRLNNVLNIIKALPSSDHDRRSDEVNHNLKGPLKQHPGIKLHMNFCFSHSSKWTRWHWIDNQLEIFSIGGIKLRLPTVCYLMKILTKWLNLSKCCSVSSSI